MAVLAALAAGPADTPVQSDPVFTATTTDGSTFQGRVRRIDPSGEFTLIAPDGSEKRVALDALFKLSRDGAGPSLAPEPAVVLFPDGDRLFRASVGGADETNLDVQSYALAGLRLPLESLLGIVFTAPQEPETTASMVRRLRTEPRNAEVLWLANNDRIAVGFHGLNEKTVDYQVGADVEKLDRARVTAIGFDASLAAYPRPKTGFIELTLSDGSRLGVVGAKVEQGQVVGTTRFGGTLKVPFAEIARVHARTPSIVYLTEREPVADKYVPYIGPPRPYRRDETVDGLPLKLAGQEYDRGLGTQSRTLLAYRVEPGDKRFQATVGVDDRAGALGSVVFRVLLDKDEAYVSPPLTAGGPPKSVDVDVSRAGLLILITEFGDRGGVRDVADWVEARVIR